MTATSNRPSLPQLPNEFLAFTPTTRAAITRYAMRAVDEALAATPPLVAAVPAQTGEVARLAEEAKSLVVAALNAAESTMPPFVGVTPGQHATCLALDAIDRLATLAHSPTVASPALGEVAQTPDLQLARDCLDDAMKFAPDTERWGRWNRGVVELDMAIATSPALVAEVGGLREALEQIEGWSRAYPLPVFPEPTPEQWAQLHAAAMAFSPGLDRFSASNMRHVVLSVGNLARAALAATPVVIAGEKL